MRLLILLTGLLMLATGSASGQPIDEIDLRVVRFGPGNVARTGDWVGILAEIQDPVGDRRVVLRITGHDPDGDRPVYDREIVTSTQRQSYWLYLRLPYGFDSFDNLTLSAYSAREAAGGPFLYEPEDLLGQVSVAPKTIRDPTESMIAVVGGWHYGLRAYGDSIDGRSFSPAGHELTRVVHGLEAAEIPDRWHGLVSFDALVWGSVNDRADPTRLTREQSDAVEQWVRRGGHLIVVLPPVGQTWDQNSTNRLARLLPAVTWQRNENVELEPYRALLTPSPTQPLPTKTTVHTFEPREGALESEASCVLQGPDGEWLVARRSLGSGAVTVVGLDLSNNALRAAGIPDAEAFWHRVLGRRGELLSAEEMRSQQQNYRNSRNAVDFDSDIQAIIAKSGRAVTGVLLGFIVFVIYWLLAGPAGFALLSKSGKRQHAWLGFVVASIAFTAIAWTGATLIRPHRVEGTHLTFLEQVHGQSEQRARTWMTLLIPRYGSATVRVGEPLADDQIAGSVQPSGVIAPWEPQSTDNAPQGSFPDNRAYRVASAKPDEITVPTRSTVKQLRFDWAGPAQWQMPAPVGQPGDLNEPELRLIDQGVVEGTLRHGLPGSLTDVVIVVVRRPEQIPQPGQSLRSRMIAVARAFKLTGAWAPGVDLRLEDVTNEDNLSNPAEAANYFTDLVLMGRPTLTSVRPDAHGAPERLTALRFFSQLAPPDFQQRGVSDRLARRSAGHGWDLGRWFTQPSVIIVGHLVVSPGSSAEDGCPTPIYVDGSPLASNGRTVVSWIYPLEPDPPKFRARPSEDPEKDEG